MYVYAVLIGLGYGAFMSVDLALMTQVLPAREAGDEAVGKDLGILTTAINIPQILAPVLAAWVLTVSGNNYPLLFVLAAGFVVAGAFFVLPIRSVR
jgi:MFS family permease